MRTLIQAVALIVFASITGMAAQTGDETDAARAQNIYPQIARIFSDDLESSDRFGSSVAIGGDTLVVGAVWADGGPGNPLNGAGAVYVFERDHGGVDNWGQSAVLIPDDALEELQFGHVVAISENTIVVGVPTEDGGTGSGFYDSGAVYVFERGLGGPDNWGQAAKLTSSDLQEKDRFGESVAVDGDTIVIGALSEDGGEGNPLFDSGSVYIFQRNLGGTGNWGQAKKLAASDAQSGDYFGVSVSIDVDTIVVGAVREDGGPGDPITWAGAAYIFDRDFGGQDNWGQTGRLVAGEPQVMGFFGTSTGIYGDTIVVGAMFEDVGPDNPVENAGAAYIFERNLGGAGNWGQSVRLIAHDPGPGDYFGKDVSIHADTIAIGVPDAPGDFGFGSVGATYIFERNLGGSDNWNEAGKMRGDAQQYLDQYGISVAVGLEEIVVATLREDNGPGNIIPDAGSVYLYKLVHYTHRAYLPRSGNCKLLYSDDFSNHNSGWPEVDTGLALYEYKKGEYRVLVPPPFGLAGAYPGPSFAEYLVTTDVRNVSNLPGTYGLLFGQATGWTDFYTFEIDSAQHYEIWRYDGYWLLEREGITEALQAGTAVNTIAIERRLYDIIAFVNGVEIDSFPSATPADFLHVGVWVTGGPEENLDIRFDNYKVEPLGCGWSLSVPLLQPEVMKPHPMESNEPAWIEPNLPLRDK